MKMDRKIDQATKEIKDMVERQQIKSKGVRKIPFYQRHTLSLTNIKTLRPSLLRSMKTIGQGGWEQEIRLSDGALVTSRHDLPPASYRRARLFDTSFSLIYHHFLSK
jgi:hypothetical protein